MNNLIIGTSCYVGNQMMIFLLLSVISCNSIENKKSTTEVSSHNFDWLLVERKRNATIYK
jgi:hypothetical protein